jgi:hypothetical protein
MERHDGKNNHVSFDEGGHAYFSDHELEALPVPEVGDLVRVTKFGRWQAQEGHITSVDSNRFYVDLEYDWNRPEFKAEDLEVVEKIKPKPVRIEGKPIKPEDVRRGDTISVVTTEDKDVKRTIIIEATVDKIVPKSSGSVLHFQTRSGAHIHTADNFNKAVISLVKSIESDLDFQNLSKHKTGDIIGFANEEGEPETNIAVKQDGDMWSVLEDTKYKNVATVGLVNILKKKNVTFSVIREASDTPVLPFPVGTNVKVSKAYSESLSKGDYRVVIAGDTISSLKSRGISAATHSVPNRWLTKD